MGFAIQFASASRVEYVLLLVEYKCEINKMMQGGGGVQMKPIAIYMEAEEVQRHGQGQGEQIPVSLIAIRSIIVQELGKIEVEI